MLCHHEPMTDTADRSVFRTCPLCEATCGLEIEIEGRAIKRIRGDRDDTPDPLGMPLQPILAAEAQRRIARAAHHPDSGAEKLANYFVGQIVGDMNQPKSAGQVVMDMVEEFIEATESLAAQLRT